MEREFIFHIRTRLNKLGVIFSKHPDNSIGTFTRLFRKIMNSSRIPFEGEPLRGIQLMGILETRLLDFKNLIILSLNEGVMPAAPGGQSFIPANLRYAFGMPTREDRDAIYAYYFYRLIQRAENIEIMYNSKTEGVRTGEPSRYISQLKYLFDMNIRFETLSFRIAEKKTVDVTIEKTDEVMERLAAFTGRGERKLSPTSVTTYLDCPLRFYFTYVAGIREEDEVTEDIDASGFGTLLHRTMELLYLPYREKMVDEAAIGIISSAENVETCLNKAFREEFLHTSYRNKMQKPEGRNIIIYEMIRKMASAVLQYDRGEGPVHDPGSRTERGGDAQPPWNA